jgi:hypothetical protein
MSGITTQPLNKPLNIITSQTTQVHIWEKQRSIEFWVEKPEQMSVHNAQVRLSYEAEHSNMR